MNRLRSAALSIGARWAWHRRRPGPMMSPISIAASDSIWSSAMDRRRLRHLCPHARPLHRRAHSRQADGGAAEHAGRRQPPRRQLALTMAPQGRHRHRLAEPGDADRSGARPARHSVRRAQVQLDRQSGGGQQHPVRVGGERRDNIRRGEDQSISPSARPGRVRRRCSIRRSPTTCSAPGSRSSPAIRAAATSISRSSVTSSTAVAAIRGRR